MIERYKVLPKRIDSVNGLQIWGMTDTARGLWISESYSKEVCQYDADYMNSLHQEMVAEDQILQTS